MNPEPNIIALWPQESAEERKVRRIERTYTETSLKKVLFAFARDMERVRELPHWRADRLRRFIESAFDFD